MTPAYRRAKLLRRQISDIVEIIKNLEGEDCQKFREQLKSLKTELNDLLFEVAAEQKAAKKYAFEEEGWNFSKGDYMSQDEFIRERKKLMEI